MNEILMSFRLFLFRVYLPLEKKKKEDTRQLRKENECVLRKVCNEQEIDHQTATDFTVK